MSTKKVKIKVNRSIILSDDKKTRLDPNVNGGVHEIDEEMYNHWFIRGQIALKNVHLVSKKSEGISVLPKSGAVKEIQPVASPKINENADSPEGDKKVKKAERVSKNKKNKKEGE